MTNSSLPAKQGNNYTLTDDHDKDPTRLKSHLMAIMHLFTFGKTGFSVGQSLWRCLLQHWISVYRYRQIDLSTYELIDLTTRMAKETLRASFFCSRFISSFQWKFSSTIN